MKSLSVFGMKQTAADENTADKGVVTIPAASDVAAGVPVLLTEAGAVREMSPALSVVQANNVTVGASISKSVTSLFYKSGYFTTSIHPSCPENAVLLEDGNVFYAFAGDGTYNYKNVNGIILNPHGYVVKPRFTVAETDTNNGAFRSCLLDNGNIAVVVAESKSYFVTIVSQEGEILVPKKLLLEQYANGVALAYFSLIPCDSGFAVAFNEILNGASQVRVKRFDNAGDVVFDIETLATGASVSVNIIWDINTKDFIVRRLWGSNPYYVSFYRIGFDGTIKGTIQTIPSYDNIERNIVQHSMAFLSDGSVIVTVLVAPSQYVKVYKLPLAHTSYTDVDYWDAVTVNKHLPHVLVLEDDGFIMFANGQLLLYNSKGDRMWKVDRGATSDGDTQYGYFKVFSAGAAGFKLYARTTASNTTQHYFDLVDHLGQLVGSRTAIFPSAIGTRFHDTVIEDNSGRLFYVGEDTATIGVQFAAVSFERSSIFGVSLNNAEKGQPVKIATKGSYLLEKSYPNGGSFDQRAATILGNKGFLSGNSALLFGVEG